MALEHFIRVFIDRNGTAKGDCCHYDEKGNLTGTDALDSRIIADIQALMVTGDDPEPKPDDLPEAPAKAPTRAAKTTKKETKA